MKKKITIHFVQMDDKINFVGFDNIPDLITKNCIDFHYIKCRSKNGRFNTTSLCDCDGNVVCSNPKSCVGIIYIDKIKHIVKYAYECSESEIIDVINNITDFDKKLELISEFFAHKLPKRLVDFCSNINVDTESVLNDYVKFHDINYIIKHKTSYSK